MVRKNAVSYLQATGLIAGLTLLSWFLRGHLTLANFTMIYILAVLVIAIRRGTGPALLAAFISFLCINFFLIVPYYTFIVADPRELLDLFVYLIVATLAGRLAARARHQAEAAHQRAYEQEILYRLTRSFNQITTSDGVYDSLTTVLKQDLKARQLFILPYATLSLAEDQTVHYLLLQTGTTIYATLCAAFQDVLSPSQERLLNTCASQAAMALQRIDLTERARRSQQYEESDRLKTAILHAISHDLRTPITVIKTSASNLRTLQERLSPDQQRDIAQSIEHEADHLNKLVGNLLDMSRLKAGALTLNDQPNSLEEVVGDVAARVWDVTGQERIKIEFPDDMPLVKFDYGLMLQALTNLVENGLRYEPPQSRIEIRGCVQGDEAVMRIANHGEPVPVSERQQIMEPFYHGKDGHIGLGLPIARGIIEAHQGRLWVEDTPGGGATFAFALPITGEEGKTP